MGQTTNKWDKVLEVFYEQSEKLFTVREIAKLTKIPKSTVQKYLVELKKSNLIDEKNKAKTTLLFRTKKVNFYIEKMIETNLIDHLKEKLNPSCIILFGSFRKGESEKDSDIDIFIETQEKKELNLESYEKKMKHDIHLFIEKDINKLPENLWHNVINGIRLDGFVRFKR